jgi:hypothetical protein
MTKPLSAAAFFLGAIIVVWMGLAFVGSNLLALAVTVVIGAVYAAGFVEMFRYQQATATLSNALNDLANKNPDNTFYKISDLNAWLGKLHPSLRNAVRLRIEGEHIGLPAPVLTPYLVGLLVMLGLLGTFVGMVDTLKGAVLALEGTSELEAVRAGLAAPIKGLGLAFGTSVAGVAASAMLGFISTLSRRERMLISRQLDSKVSTVFQDFSLSYNRQQTYKAMQAQAQALPQVASQLSQLAERLEQMSKEISTSLIARQDQFHESVKTIYTDLSSSVETSLKESLAASGRLAGESIQPAIKELTNTVSRESQQTHQQLSRTVELQLQNLTAQFAKTSDEVSLAWQSGLATQTQSNAALVKTMHDSLDAFSEKFQGNSNSLLESFQKTGSDWIDHLQITEQTRLDHWHESFKQTANALQQTASDLSQQSQSSSNKMLAEMSSLVKSSEELVEARTATEAAWLQSYNQRMDQLTATLASQLDALREAEENRGQTAVARLATLESTVSEHLAKLGNALEEPMTRLIQTASETPRAAAEVIDRLRAEISRNLERDNSLLDERRRIMTELDTLSGSMAQAAIGQREAVEQMVNACTDMLQETGSRFSHHVSSEVVKLTDIVDHFAGSASELSSLGDAFGLAVQLFNETNNQLIDNLARIEESLQNNTARSDEQMAYYVAQAREIIDHNMMSQQEIIDHLRLLSRSGELAGAEVE